MEFFFSNLCYNIYNQCVEVHFVLYRDYYTKYHTTSPYENHCALSQSFDSLAQSHPSENPLRFSLNRFFLFLLPITFVSLAIRSLALNPIHAATYINIIAYPLFYNFISWPLH
jgi:hypothetical protein